MVVFYVYEIVKTGETTHLEKIGTRLHLGDAIKFCDSEPGTHFYICPYSLDTGNGYLSDYYYYHNGLLDRQVGYPVGKILFRRDDNL